jgi:hypothetical protein
VFVSLSTAIMTWVVGVLLASTSLNLLLWQMAKYHVVVLGDALYFMLCSIIGALFTMTIAILAMTLTGTLVSNLFVAVVLLLFVRIIALEMNEFLYDLIPVYDFDRSWLCIFSFENYLPCSFGLYDSPEKITSASVWASIEALNSKIDGDTSEATRTLADATAKAARYYPNATFNPEEVRVYNKNTQTFMGVAMPVQPLECILLSFEIKDGQITLYYEDKPDATDPEAEIITYATTLKNSTEEGYFSFVSSVRTDAVG